MGISYEIIVLGTDGYEGKENDWYGDCIIIYNHNNKIMVVYDCGSEQHAERVIEFMSEKEVDKTDIILSHNDSDHFDGILTLIDNGKVEKIFTTLLLKYVDEILDILDNDCRTRDSTKKRILDLYDNIASLEGNNLRDIFIDEDDLPENILFIGPDKETMINTVAKAIKENDIHTKEGTETLVNATSLQIKVLLNNNKNVLLVSDASVENIECDFTEYFYIQLPHHGNMTSADDLFEKINDNVANHVFIVSDNTGTSNGGSDDLMKSEEHKGIVIKNTIDGDIELGLPVFATITNARNDYGICSGL